MYTVTLFCKEKQEETVAFRFSHHSKGIYHDTSVQTSGDAQNYA